jgi:hypothetical protein
MKLSELVKSDLCFYFKGRWLKEDMTLKECGVQKDDIVFFVNQKQLNAMRKQVYFQEAFFEKKLDVLGVLFCEYGTVGPVYCYYG